MAKYLKHYPLNFNKDNILLESSTQLFLPFRLHIMNILFKEKEIDFVSLRNRLNISDGSLFSHTKFLEKENLLFVRKEFLGRKPHTIYSITEKGKNEFTKLRERLLEVLK